MQAAYRADELALIANAYHVAQVLMDGGYRPCGRPFINHLVGTASVLVHYGLRAETVASGLLTPRTRTPRRTAAAVRRWRCSARGARWSRPRDRVARARAVAPA